MALTDRPLCIVGQGLAGSLLGWCCERAGVPFRIVDAGHASAASRVGAGLINPLTGRRLVPTWRIAEWRDPALRFYQELERELGIPLVTPIRVHRRFRREEERARFLGRREDPAVGRWWASHDDDGIWIHDGAQIDTAGLIAELRKRWQTCGWLDERRLVTEPAAGVDDGGAVIWCLGGSVPGGFEHVPWERAPGEILQGRLPGLASGVLLNDGHWVLPGPAGWARVGATYHRDGAAAGPTTAAREELVTAARRLTGRELEVGAHEAAVRMTTADRRPVIGWHPQRAGWGVFGGLGSKGALWAPQLAQQWLGLLTAGRPVDPEVDVARFGAGRGIAGG
jgi:glycine oxidase